MVLLADPRRDGNSGRTGGMGTLRHPSGDGSEADTDGDDDLTVVVRLRVVDHYGLLHGSPPFWNR
ncbi:hypothetical protein P2Q00_23025 [Streptomyces coacervatus]|uniref:hypothetical protein n=1 Tax=Streptomyces coacervatus TaxID=647381 RepID=UPI0023D9E120|nr:hypothetical protein [Streptomyces coacervatus]MDF2268288.1 hypothetical protein [Streptomyces coacervatus]